jgi:hypothetical protein
MDDVQSSAVSGLNIPTAKELPVIYLHETKEVNLTGLKTVFPLSEAVKRVNNAVR